MLTCVWEVPLTFGLQEGVRVQGYEVTETWGEKVGRELVYYN